MDYKTRKSISMRNPIPILSLLLIVLGLSSCRDKQFTTFTANLPIYQSLEDWRASDLSLRAPQAIRRPGKIYIYQNLLLVNEYMEGIHLYDNTNPANPIALGFLPVLGNSELAIRNDVLYLDSYYDLLAFDLSDPGNPRLRHRLQDLFEFSAFDRLASLDPEYPLASYNPEKGVIVGWEVGEVTQESNLYFYRNTWAYSATAEVALTSGDGGGSVGKGGSTARFTLYDQYLYALRGDDLLVIDVAAAPSQVNVLTLSQVPETLFPADGHLFVGTTTGMLIYDLASPAAPSFRSQIEHIFSCDPVVVDGDRAYLTLSRDQQCRAGDNALWVIDISNLSAPHTLYTFPMTNPKGLGVDGNALFLCDAVDGLRVFNRTDDAIIAQNIIAQFAGYKALDVIPNPFNKVLILTGSDGIYQYDYSDLNNITEISHLPIQL